MIVRGTQSTHPQGLIYRLPKPLLKQQPLGFESPPFSFWLIFENNRLPNDRHNASRTFIYNQPSQFRLSNLLLKSNQSFPNFQFLALDQPQSFPNLYSDVEPLTEPQLKSSFTLRNVILGGVLWLPNSQPKVCRTLMLYGCLPSPRSSVIEPPTESQQKVEILSSLVYISCL